MALLSTQKIVRDGLAPTFAAATSGGDTVNGHADFFVVKNASASTVTVTVATPATLETGDAYPDKAFSVAAGAEQWVPVIAPYVNDADGLVALTYSAVASVTVAAFSL